VSSAEEGNTYKF